VLATSIGKEYADKELSYKHYETGKTEMVSLGKFFGLVLQESMLRNLQTVNMLFSEVLSYNITPKDRVLA